MKRFLPIIPLLGALAGTASAAPYVLPSPQYGALTPYDWQPVYALEGLYSFAQHKHMPDTCGLRGSFNLYNRAEGSFRHQFDINVAAAWGNDDVPLTRYMPKLATELLNHRADLDLFLLPCTLGYNLNIELLDELQLYLGGKAGYAWSHGKLKASGTTRDGQHSSFSHSHSDGGFTFSVGGGLKLQCSDVIYVNAGYEFGRSYLNYHLEGGKSTYGTHTIFLGVGRRF